MSLFIIELFYQFVNINYIMVLFLDCDTGLVEIDNIIQIIFFIWEIPYTQSKM